jgi:hypothetical protein
MNLLEEFCKDTGAESDCLPLPVWTEKKVHIPEGKFSFDEHPEMRAPYADTHPLQVFQKSAQSTVSTLHILKALHFLEQYPYNAIYFLPTRDYAEDFGTTRIDPIVNDSPDLKENKGFPWSSGIKRYGYGLIHMKGTEAIIDTASVPGDIIFADEIDIANQQNLKTARERLLHSKLAAYYAFCKPTVKGYGVNELFDFSDKRYYLFKCKKCNTDNDVVSNIEQDEKAYILKKQRKQGDLYYFPCEKCGAALDPSKGKWVAMNPGRDVHGWQVSMAYWTRQIPRKQNAAHALYDALYGIDGPIDLEHFWRALMGLPYAGKMQQLTEGILKKMAGDHHMSPAWPGWSFAGIDTGKKIHVSIAHPMGFRLIYHWFEELDDFDQLDGIMRKHNVRFAYIDRAPESHGAKKFAKKYKERVAVQDFDTDKDIRIGKTIKGWDEIERVSLPRTESIDEYIESVISGICVLPALIAHAVMKDVYKHNQKLLKVKVTDKRDRVKYEYKHGVDNHYGIAAMLALFAAYRFWMKASPGSGALPAGGKIPVRGNNASIH